MKRMHVVLSLVLAGVAASAMAEHKPPAAAVKKPVTEWTCREFIALGDQYRPSAVYWASAYAKGGKPEASELDIDGTEQITPMIVQDCKKEPNASFWQKLKAAWDEVEHKTQTDAKKVEKNL